MSRKEQIESILDVQWKRNYFLTCRFDFLVCNREGIPLGVFEYNGGYHKRDDDQKFRDQFKRDVLQYLGIGLTIIDATNFKSFLNTEAFYENV